MEVTRTKDGNIDYGNGVIASIYSTSISVPKESIPEENRTEGGLEWPKTFSEYHKESFEDAKKSWRATGKVYHLLGMDENGNYTKIKEYPEYFDGEQKFIAIPWSTHAKDFNKFHNLPHNKALDENKEGYFTRNIGTADVKEIDGRCFVYMYPDISGKLVGGVNEAPCFTDMVDYNMSPRGITDLFMGDYLKNIFLVEAVPGQKYKKGQERYVMTEELKAENKELRDENSKLQKDNKEQQKRIEELEKHLQEKENENTNLKKTVKILKDFIKSRVMKANLFNLAKLKKGAKELDK